MTSRKPTLESSALSLAFTEDLQIREITNRYTGERVRLHPGRVFRIDLERETLTPETCPLRSIESMSQGWITHFDGERYVVDLEYSLEGVSLVIRPRREGPFLIREIAFQRYALHGDRLEFVPFRHGQCVTYFMRMQRGSFISGIRVPVVGDVQAKASDFEPSYPVNYRWPGGPYRSETFYWASCVFKECR